MQFQQTPRSRLSKLFFIVLAALFCLTVSAKAEWILVKRVIDGDTFEARDGTRVRIRGIDTPETKHPTKPKEPGGEAATQLAKVLLENSVVWAEGTKRDKYGRRLASIRLRNNMDYAEIVKRYGLDKNYRTLVQRVKTAISEPDAPTVGPSSHRYESTEFVWVNGYARKDGTKVKGFYRKKARSTKDH